MAAAVALSFVKESKTMILKPSALLYSLLCLATVPVFAQDQETAAARYREVKNARLSSNERIAAYEKLLAQSPADPKIQAGLAEAFIQKLRETTDFAYLNRASALVDKMLAADSKSYDGLRLSAEIETHRHNFPKAAQLAEDLTERNPSDTGSLGMLGDSLMEMGQYAAAESAYRRMIELGPNLASYNRIAYHRFVTGQTGEALSWMNLAVEAGSKVPENLACVWLNSATCFIRPVTRKRRTPSTIAPWRLCPAITARTPRSAASTRLPATTRWPSRISKRPSPSFRFPTMPRRSRPSTPSWANRPRRRNSENCST